MSRKEKMILTLICKLQMELRWQVSIFYFTVFFFRSLRLFHTFSLKSLSAARKGTKLRKRGFSRVSGGEFNTVE